MGRATSTATVHLRRDFICTKWALLLFLNFLLLIAVSLVGKPVGGYSVAESPIRMYCVDLAYLVLEEYLMCMLTQSGVASPTEPRSQALPTRERNMPLYTPENGFQGAIKR